MSDERIIEITSRAHFEEVAQNELVLVDFYTPGCPPCTTVEKIFPSLVAMFPGLTIAKINEEDNQDLVEDFDVDQAGYPSLMLFRDGRCVDTDVPFGSKADLIHAIKAAIEDEG